jgi:PTH1 family peptidyl-tRNA hydrolase
LRFGIGNDFPRGGQVDFVLGEFGDEDMKNMEERLKVAGDMVKSYALSGIQFTMNQFNKK